MTPGAPPNHALKCPFTDMCKDLESSERGAGGFHQLEAERGLDPEFELAMIRFYHVQLFGRPVAYRCLLRSLPIDSGTGCSAGWVLVGGDRMWLVPVRRGALIARI